MELQHELKVNYKLLIALEIDLQKTPKEITKPQAKYEVDKVILNLKLISETLEREIKQALYDKEIIKQKTLL